MAVKINKGSAVDLPLTPLIDTVFNLLIFFLVATKFAEVERELPVALPQASEAQPITARPSEFFINIDAAGQYYVTGQIVTVAELDAKLNQAWVNDHNTTVIIRADRRCQWDPVVTAINACLKAKIRNYNITTRDTRDGG
jgi:biopolymer transport protein ExbD